VDLDLPLLGIFVWLPQLVSGARDGILMYRRRRLNVLDFAPWEIQLARRGVSESVLVEDELEHEVAAVE
jgi:hypothetical protein